MHRKRRRCLVEDLKEDLRHDRPKGDLQPVIWDPVIQDLIVRD